MLLARYHDSNVGMLNTPMTLVATVSSSASVTWALHACNGDSEGGGGVHRVLHSVLRCVAICTALRSVLHRVPHFGASRTAFRLGTSAGGRVPNVESGKDE